MRAMAALIVLCTAPVAFAAPKMPAKIFDPLIGAHFSVSTQCAMHKKTLRILTIDVQPKPRICTDVAGLLQRLDIRLDVDQNNVIELRLVTNTSDEPAYVLERNMTTRANGERDVFYVQSNTYIHEQPNHIVRAIVHAQRHLVQQHVVCQVHKTCAVLARTDFRYTPFAHKDVHIFVEGDTIVSVCRHMEFQCLVPYVQQAAAHRAHVRSSCIDTYKQAHISFCAYALVRRMGADFDRALRPAYRGKQIDWFLEVLRYRGALTSKRRFQTVVDTVFRKYTTYTKYDIAQADARASARLRNALSTIPRS